MRPLFLIILVVAVGFAWFKLLPSSQSKAKYEEAPYTIEKSEGSFQIRRYPALTYAEVTVEGSREEAANQGFRALFGYITGKNGTQEKIAMTIPVFQELVAFGVASDRPPSSTQWAFRFVMPQASTHLPMPQDSRIKIYQSTPFRVATVKFNGRFNSENLVTHKNKLDEWVNKKGFTFEPHTHEIYAAYNGPFTWPSNRRNEVLFRIK
jgi:hypothetical protein